MVIIASCKKAAINITIADGTYAGTFQRQGAGGGQISKVVITFSGNQWHGQSAVEKYPALCYGTYQTDGAGNITFENARAWTADFDWTIILSHTYKITGSNNYFEMRKQNANSTDIYQLTKQ